MISQKWRDAGVFHVEVGDDVPASEDAYSIVIPPPNVTAALHLGHALNNTLQDVLIRFNRMKGKSTLWMPGTDHAGIATQTVVEKRLLAEGIKRLEMGREAFVERTQAWKDEYEAVILSQLADMGASVDEDRTRFTMDDMCATAVRQAFFVLFRDGLIYRGKRLVNWDPATRTALSDDEVEMEEVDGHMWYLRYPLSDGSGHVTVATTRPETMLGDTAVAVNPDDPRAAGLRGKSVLLPIVGREIPIVEDDYVVMADAESSDTKAQIATGFLKVTPAHDPNDWDIGLRHDLPVINVMGPDGSITTDYGWEDASDESQPFVGLSREDARTAIVAWFDEHDLLEEVRDYSHSVGHSYRSHVPIEPWLSDQWYVAVTDDRLRGSALRAQVGDQSAELPEGVSERTGGTGDGELRFYPDRYAKTYYQWHDGIRDWCISRQLWWGHQIPVWTKLVPTGTAADPAWEKQGAAVLVRSITPDESEIAVCVPPEPTLRRTTGVAEQSLIDELEAAGFTRDPDVLDTWFSSGLWPMSTMGWPYPDDYPDTAGLLEAFNPTSVLITAREIITLWVSRMVMFNRYFMDGQLPFDDVFIHAMIQDGHGQKMSKSLGNGVDPRDIIATHGSDAMRFALVQMTTDTQDVKMPVDLICPWTNEAFTPEFITTAAGHVVAAPLQACPTDPSKMMVSAYGVAAGIETPSEEQPLALNTSSKFDLGRNFANKVFNAMRFGIGRLADAKPHTEPVAIADLSFVDRWILSRLAETTSRIERDLERYHFNAVADSLYSFVWNDVCDRYLEAIKPTLNDDPNQQVVLGAVLDAVLRLMHPVCPFVTESLWSAVTAAGTGEVEGLTLPKSELLAAAAWPVVDEALLAPEISALFDRADNLGRQIRTVRSQRNVKPKQRVTLHVTKEVNALVSEAQGMVETLAGLNEVVAVGERPADASAFAFEGHELLLSGLSAELDVEAETERLEKVIADKQKEVGGLNGRLSNKGYVDNAPPHLVEETRGQLAAAEADLAAAQAALAGLA